MTSPVLLIIFNRPDTTRQVFESIRKAKPSRLYVAADGARPDRPGEVQKCEEVKRIASEVDWPCSVQTLYRATNMGCGMGPCSAITWFFEHESEGIILEDDCLPSPSFFPFCDELLERYRHDTRIMQIGGNNLERPQSRDQEYSYWFSSQISIWGWATWRRAWKLHDFYLGHYLEINKKGYLQASYESIYERDFYQYVFQKMHTGDETTNSKTIWDYQWQFACKINSGLVIIPNRNLIKNLGFGPHGTNTLNPTGVGYDLTLESIDFPLAHPEFVMVNKIKDKEIFRMLNTSRMSRTKSQIKRFLPKPLMENIVKPLRLLFSL